MRKRYSKELDCMFATAVSSHGKPHNNQPSKAMFRPNLPSCARVKSDCENEMLLKNSGSSMNFKSAHFKCSKFENTLNGKFMNRSGEKLASIIHSKAEKLSTSFYKNFQPQCRIEDIRSEPQNGQKGLTNRFSNSCQQYHNGESSQIKPQHNGYHKIHVLNNDCTNSFIPYNNVAEISVSDTEICEESLTANCLHEDEQFDANITSDYTSTQCSSTNGSINCRCNKSTSSLVEINDTDDNLIFADSNFHENNFLHDRKHVKLKEPCTVSSAQELPSENCKTNNSISPIGNCQENIILKDSCSPKNVGLENLLSDISDRKEFESPGSYVLESNKRLKHQLARFCEEDVEEDKELTCRLLENIESRFEIKVEDDNAVFSCQPKKMRSSPNNDKNVSTSVANVRLKSNSSEDSFDETFNGYFKCEWHECVKQHHTVDKLIKHVKKEHIQPASKNDVFVCLWQNCKFSNQPSCSYKWLLNHVLRHCDVKPFKCVIFGCDMAFVTQNGLARHVPTHFNEGKVRRTCVMTSLNEVSRNEETVRSRRSLNAKLNCADAAESKDIGCEEVKKISRFERFIDHNRNRNATDNTNQKFYSQVKKKIEQSTSSPGMNSGFSGKLFRIEHKVTGRRTVVNGASDMLLTPSLDRIFPQKSFWFDAIAFQKRKSTYVDIPVYNLSTDAKSSLYDIEHASTRRRRKRK